MKIHNPMTKRSSKIEMHCPIYFYIYRFLEMTQWEQFLTTSGERLNDFIQQNAFILPVTRIHVCASAEGSFLTKQRLELDGKSILAP